MSRPGWALVVDAVRLAVGTLTVLPVRAPRVDGRVAGWAMVLAPLAGLLLAVPGVVLVEVLAGSASPLLVAVLMVAAVALLTRGLHLDGLADTADGLGSGRPGSEALEVMRRGDVGPFGVVTVVLVLLVQVSALAQLVVEALGGAGLVVGLVIGRLVLPLACSRGVPAARTDGLGSAVAGSVSRWMAVAAVALAGVVAVGAWLALGGGGVGVDLPGALLLAPLGLLAGAAVGWRAVRRLGGVTGDVLGAMVETTTAATLVLLALG